MRDGKSESYTMQEIVRMVGVELKWCDSSTSKNGGGMIQKLNGYRRDWCLDFFGMVEDLLF